MIRPARLASAVVQRKNTMEASKVYYTDFRCPVGTSLLEKLRRLCLAAGIRQLDMEGKFVAIKMHFGELGNLAFLRPNYAKVVADLCKEQGGMPFLTDCNTLYPGSRKNALEHLTCAQLNGFWPMTTGCQVPTASGAPTRWRCRCRAANTARPPRSAVPSWTRMCSSA